MTSNPQLTESEIKHIEALALEQPELRMPNVINPIPIGKLTIMNLSEKNSLILIKGDKYTGFDHIHQRHEFFSWIPHWKEVNGNYYLDNPERLSPKSVPILDYVVIADEVYKEENLNSTDCKAPDLYDMYTGIIEYYGGKHLFHLLLHKGSKIIHTLYPDESIQKRKKPKKFHFFRGKVSGQHDLVNDIISIKIPYLNEKDIPVYTVNIFLDYHLGIEKKIIIINSDSFSKQSFVEIGERPLSERIELQWLIPRYQVSDLYNIEEYIKAIDQQIKNEKAQNK